MPQSGTNRTRKMGNSSRRKFLKVAGASSVIAIAGCTGDGDDGNGDANGDDGNGDANGDDANGGVTNGNGDVDSVVIGSNHPLTGSLAFTGERMDQAVRMVADKKNEEGGIESMGGAEVEVISGDNEAAQELGGEVQQELIDDGADILVGTYTSPTALAATGVAEQNEVPFVIDVAAADEVIQGQGLNWCYRVQPPAFDFGVKYAEFVPQLIRDAGGTYETAALFIVDNAYGDSNLAALRQLLPENGVEIVEETRYNIGDGTVDTQVTRMQDADPDAIIATTYVEGGVTLCQALQDQNYRPDYLTACGSATFVERDANEDIGEFANGIVNNNYAPDRSRDEVLDVEQEFEDRYDRSFGSNTAMAYATAQVCVQAFEEAGTADNETLNQTLKDIVVEDHIMAMPPIEFNEEGDNLAALTPAQQVHDFFPEVVYPEEFETTPFDLDLLRG